MGYGLNTEGRIGQSAELGNKGKKYKTNCLFLVSLTLCILIIFHKLVSDIYYLTRVFDAKYQDSVADLRAIVINIFD